MNNAQRFAWLAGHPAYTLKFHRDSTKWSCAPWWAGEYNLYNSAYDAVDAAARSEGGYCE
jgi:hypothetical protein